MAQADAEKLLQSLETQVEEFVRQSDAFVAKYSCPVLLAKETEICSKIQQHKESHECNQADILEYTKLIDDIDRKIADKNCSLQQLQEELEGKTCRPPFMSVCLGQI